MVVGMLALAKTLETMNLYWTSTEGSESKLAYKRGSIGTACKTAVVFSVYAALYVAHFQIHHRGYAIALGGAAFIVHPLAAIETMAIIHFSFAVDNALQAFVAKANFMREIGPQLKRAIEQTRQEGFQVPDQWPASSRFSKILHQTGIKKCQEIFDALLKSENKYDAAQASLAEMRQLSLRSIKFFGGFFIEVLAAFNFGLYTYQTDKKRIYDPLDLNEKIKNFSIWLTP
jgi:hypothetical protein